MTPRSKKRGTSAIEDTQLKDTVRILKCGPQWVKNHRERIVCVPYFSDTNSKRDPMYIQFLRAHGERLGDACPYLRVICE